MEAVLPIHFESNPMGTSQALPSSSFGQLGISIGEVKGVVYPNDKNSQSKKNVEYVVETIMRNGMGIPVPTNVPCVVVDTFGSVGDFSLHSFRTASRKPDRDKLVYDGAQVLVAFVSGDTSHGFIIGALRHSKSPQETLVGRFFRWVFNGIDLDINDDGEVKVQANGATKQDGSPDTRNKNNKGPYFQFTKTGDAYVTDNNGQSIQISSKDKTVYIKGENARTQVSKIAQLHGGKTIYIGSDKAKENLVLGQQLNNALNDLFKIFIDNSQSWAIGNLGFPTPLQPMVLQSLINWKMKYLTPLNGPPKILSKNKFTER
jgi:hypothetical protein